LAHSSSFWQYSGTSSWSCSCNSFVWYRSVAYVFPVRRIKLKICCVHLIQFLDLFAICMHIFSSFDIHSSEGRIIFFRASHEPPLWFLFFWHHDDK
jgi:hypothetical protein